MWKCENGEMNKGALVISIDFEIHWGVSDRHTIESYFENLKNDRAVVKKCLELFRENNIHATWATVGMLFCENKQELFSYVDESHRPAYVRKHISNYEVAVGAGENEKEDPYHYAPSLVKQIASTPGQEIASHTYSHFYCLEAGQTPEAFGYDLKAAKTVAKKYDVELKGIVFPANQFEQAHIDKCKEEGLTYYRGNYPSWMYQLKAKSEEGKFKRLSRLLDFYFPVNGKRIVQPSIVNGMINIPASCFLRPYSHKLSFLEGRRLARMKAEMTAAAKQKKIYHLWWHPHNFGRDMDKNFEILLKLIHHFKSLEKKYGMESLTMGEVAERFNQKKN